MSGELATETSTTSATEEVRLLGRVKWFNNKAGYGFITVTDGEQSGSDIFVHHSGIKVASEQYRYLVQGEYVEFSLDSTPNGVHKLQAKSVCGIRGGMLMCETRNDFKQSRVAYRSEKGAQEEQPAVTPRAARPPRGRGAGPREGKEWNLVKSTPRGPSKKSGGKE